MRLPLFTISAILVYPLYSQENSFQALALDPILTKKTNAIVRLDEMKIYIEEHINVAVLPFKSFT